MLEKIIFKNANLGPEEKVAGIYRQSLWSRFWAMVLALILILLPFFLIYPLFQQGIWGIIVFAVMLLFGIFLAWRIFFIHYFTAFIITDSRLIDLDQKGFLNYEITGALFNKIQDVDCEKKGIASALFNTGDIYISFIGDKKTKLKLKKIKNPQAVAGAILRQQQLFLKSNGEDATEAMNAINLLQKIKHRVGEEKFNELIAD